MEAWISIVITGAAIAGYGMMLPKSTKSGKTDSAGYQGEAAYDQLLEDLEAENRELIDAVSEFKREQDATVDKLSRQVRELERQMSEWADRDRIVEAKGSQPASVDLSQSEVAAALAEVTVPGSFSSHTESNPPPTSNGETKPAASDEIAREEAPPSASQSIKKRYAALLNLYERGRSIEQIAKELNMNKGEIQLILQLARREDTQRA